MSRFKHSLNLIIILSVLSNLNVIAQSGGTRYSSGSKAYAGGKPAEGEWQRPAKLSRANMKKQPRLGDETETPPRGAKELEYSKGKFLYADGIFYYPKGLSYVCAPGPVGARISQLPVNHATLIVQGMPYFYFYGTFYLRKGVSIYEIAEPPMGAIVYDLPLGFEKVIIDNIVYYAYADNYFKAITDSYGEVAYEVTGNPQTE